MTTEEIGNKAMIELLRPWIQRYGTVFDSWCFITFDCLFILVHTTIKRCGYFCFGVEFLGRGIFWGGKAEGFK